MRHTAYTVHLEWNPTGNPEAEYDPETFKAVDYEADEGISQREAYDDALAAHPGYYIVGHHIRWWDDADTKL